MQVAVDYANVITHTTYKLEVTGLRKKKIQLYRKMKHFTSHIVFFPNCKHMMREEKKYTHFLRIKNLKTSWQVYIISKYFVHTKILKYLNFERF